MADVYVYRLGDADLRTAHAAALEAQLAAAAGTRRVDAAFYVSPVSGCFRYVDSGRLQAPSGAPPLRTVQEVREVVRQYMSSVNRLAAEYRARRGVPVSSYPDPFPDGFLRPGETELVYGTRAGAHGQWLSRWDLVLPAKVGQTADGPVPVYGAEVEARLAADGRVASVISTIRPWTGVLRAAAHPPPTDEGEHEDVERSRARQGAFIFYVMDGIDEPMRFLAPYYSARTHLTDEHTPAAIPACVYSVVVAITSLQPDNRRLAAVVAGPNGEFSLAGATQGWRARWIYGPLESWTVGDWREATSETLALDAPGLYHVELVVEHVVTRATRATFQDVVVAAAMPTPPVA